MSGKLQPLLILGIFLGFGSGQSRYPADSLLADTSVSIFAKAGLVPIAAWQRLSFNTGLLNCQHYPSCRYMAPGP
ncbi:MAG: hypothetical protein GXO90_10430 [FCB group bacterium]|nr:hypothetical protein [FCB group bacterium]